jgi:hypothetical protein
MFATAILTVGIEAPPPYSADKSHWHFDQALLAPVEFLGDFIEPKMSLDLKHGSGRFQILAWSFRGSTGIRQERPPVIGQMIPQAIWGIDNSLID